MSEREQDQGIKYKHEHVFVYRFEMENHASWQGKRVGTQEYTLCTNYPDPNGKANRTLLESMLRMVYGHMPKSVKFLHEKV